MKLIYYGKLPGINDLTLSNRTNRYAGAFLKKTNMQRVANDFKIQARGVKFKKHVNIKINCYEANFRRDDDNVTGGASKIICDALQLANIIINDISPSIGTHAGPGAIALMYCGQEKPAAK